MNNQKLGIHVTIDELFKMDNIVETLKMDRNRASYYKNTMDLRKEVSRKVIYKTNQGNDGFDKWYEELLAAEQENTKQASKENQENDENLQKLLQQRFITNGNMLFFLFFVFTQSFFFFI